MATRLYSSCQLADGYHWLLMRSDGWIIAASDVGFPTEDSALKDLGIQKRDS